MTVFENVALPLRICGVHGQKLREWVDAVLELARDVGQALADRSSVVIEDDTADETRESQLELDFEESEIDEPTGLGDNPDNGAEPPESAEGADPEDSEADSGYPWPS